VNQFAIKKVDNNVTILLMVNVINNHTKNVSTNGEELIVKKEHKLNVEKMMIVLDQRKKFVKEISQLV
jgi:ribosomal protein L24